MTSIPLPVAEYLRLKRRKEWIPKHEFTAQVQSKLQEIGLFNQVVDSIELARSLENVQLFGMDFGRRTPLGGLRVKKIGRDGEAYGVITLNSRRKPKIQQWDCAHEVTHLWFHPPNAEIDPNDDDLWLIYEIQANWGAKEIKLPRKLFAETCAELRRRMKNVESTLSNWFGVGPAPIRYRIDELEREGYLQYIARQCSIRSRKVGSNTIDATEEFTRRRNRNWLKVTESWDTEVLAIASVDSQTNRHSEDELDDYMQAIAERAREWVNKQKAEELGSLSDDQQYILSRAMAPECPRCGNDDFDENGLFCWLCGLPRYNECTRGRFEDEEDEAICGEYNRPDARYCEMCGSPTEYLRIGFLKHWTPPEENEDGPEFEFNPDDVPF